jgi:hypothetical protein
MSPYKSQSIETAMELILSNHFEHCENPHETIYRIWLLLNIRTLTPSQGVAVIDRSEMASTAFN